MFEISLDPIGHWLLVLGIAVALLPLVAIGPSKHKTNRSKRTVLAGLRLTAMICTLLASLRPSIIYTQNKKQSATVVVVVDPSRSMTVPDSFGGKTRWESLLETMADAQDELDALREDLEVKVYTFSSEPESVLWEGGPVALPDLPTGNETAIGYCLDGILEREAGKRLASVILLSDGAQRAFPGHDVPPQKPARLLADWGYPLHTIGFGRPTAQNQNKDVALKSFQLANDQVFVKNQITALAQIEAGGYANVPQKVELLFEQPTGTMVVVASKEITLGPDGERQPLELDYTPEAPGEYKVTVRLVPQPGEMVTTNNESSTFVTVLKGGLNVLYVEGLPRVEQRFIRRALDGSPNIQLDMLGINRRNARPATTELQARLEPGKYDVVILGDVHASLLVRNNEGLHNASLLKKLQENISRGTGFMMLGGSHAFGPGAYAETPLAQVLPIEMGRLEKQTLDEPAREDLHWKGPLGMVPSQIGQKHFLLQLAGSDSANLELWQKLPKLDGANRFSGLKPRGLVLATSDQAGNPPLLVSMDFGQGRVLAMAADSSWRWAMQGQEDAHRRFWRQLVLWLARKDQTNEGNVWIRLAQRRFSPGERVDFSAGAQAADGTPTEGATYECELQLPPEVKSGPAAKEKVPDPAEDAPAEGEQPPSAAGQAAPVNPGQQNPGQANAGQANAGQAAPANAAPRKTQLRLLDQAEHKTGSVLDTRTPGDYVLTVKATKDGQLLGTTQIRFLVQASDLELDNSAADAETLKNLAAMTGGQFLPPEQFATLLRELKDKPQQLEVESQTKAEPWTSWPFFLVLAGVLCSEWFLRKKWGLQ